MKMPWQGESEEGTNRSLDGLQRTALGVMLVLVILTFIGANLHARLWQSSQWLVSTVLPATVVDLTNDERVDEALNPLRRSATLDAAARMKAQHMAKNEYFSHYAPDGTSPWYWFDQAGYSYVHAGENLAIHFTDSSEVVGAWMDSPTHRANIVGAQYTEIGVGTAKGSYQGYDTVYVVQLFGAPAAAPVVKSAVVQATGTPVKTAVAQAPTAVEEAVSQEVLAVTKDIETREVTALEESSVEEDVSVSTNTVTSTAPGADEIVVIETEPVATSTGLAPATSTATATKETEHTFGTIATKPNFVLQIVYLFLGLIVGMLLLLSIVSEVRKLHYLQALYGVGLIILMAVLWYIHSLLTTGALII